MKSRTETPLETPGERSEPDLVDGNEPRPEAFPDGIVRPIAFETPDRPTDVVSWQGHIPFAFWIVEALRPLTLVELGTHKGDSYCAFLQAVDRLKLATACYAIDTWRGDQHAGFYGEQVFDELREYHDPRYGRFSRLVRSTFDEAAAHFADASIDLLHIDGLHTYEAVKHDFERWRPKLSDRAVVLFHDINVREFDFGVWRLWDELTRDFPSFTFHHSHGLGVLAVGAEVAAPIRRLTLCEEAEAGQVRLFFSRLGGALSLKSEHAEARDAIAAPETELRTAQEQAEQGRLRSEQFERGLKDLQAENQRLIASGESLRTENAALEARTRESMSAYHSLIEEVRHLWSSSSWRLGRPVRNLLRRLRGYNKETEPIPAFDAAALRTIIIIRQSLSWELTAPLRLIHRMFHRRQHVTETSRVSNPVVRQVGISRAENLPPPPAMIAVRSDSREVPNGAAPAPEPLISVIIPSYNHASFIAQAIDSVSAQDHRNLELIVIDDGSSDNSIGIIEESLKGATSLASEFHAQRNRGAHAAINRGLEMARGEYLAILNSDDYYYPRRLSSLLNFMRVTDKQFAFSEVDHVDTDGAKLTDTNKVRFGYLNALAALPQFPTVGFVLLLYNLTVTSGNFLMSRKLFETVGLFQPYRIVHDWDYVLRVLIEVEPGFLREPLMGYRVHRGNTLSQFEALGSVEGPKVIAHYFEMVSRRKAPNVLAPTAYNWPQYFDRFVRNYPGDGNHRLVDFVPSARHSSNGT